MIKKGHPKSASFFIRIKKSSPVFKLKFSNFKTYLCEGNEDVRPLCGFLLGGWAIFIRR